MKSVFDKVSQKSSKMVTRQYSTSFSLGIQFLNRDLHDSIYGIYGFVRFADEIVDSFHDFDKKVLLSEFKRDTYLSIERGISLNPILVIFIGDWKYEQHELVKLCKINKIPTVLMMDGTIEWKHFFENPKWSYGGNEAPYFPTYCDKIFVPGQSTFRFLEFFGNKGKCEITGLPRFCRSSEFRRHQS